VALDTGLSVVSAGQTKLGMGPFDGEVVGDLVVPNSDGLPDGASEWLLVGTGVIVGWPVTVGDKDGGDDGTDDIVGLRVVGLDDGDIVGLVVGLVVT
jgi:hypothetical protein